MKLLLLLLLCLPLYSKSQSLPSIEDKTKNAKAYPWFIKWDENAGKIWLEINKLDSTINIQMILIQSSIVECRHKQTNAAL